MPETKKLYLVAGLGNPGNKYRETRHNAGFLLIDHVADAYGIALDKSKFDAIYGRGKIENRDVILVKPMSYMNLSGHPVFRLAEYYRISSREMVVIHDDIDLALGRIKIKEKGGHGGHKGLKSVMQVFGGDCFARLRIGVGRSESGIDVADYVLGRFSKAEQEILQQIIEKAQDALVAILCKGIRDSMNEFNQKTLIISS